MLTSSIISNGINGNVKIPGDKSISHRAIIISSISKGYCEISNLLYSEDVLNTLEAFKLMGVKVENKKNSIIIYGKGLNSLLAPKKEIDLEVVEKSDLIVVDDLNQAKTECGDLIQAGVGFDWSNVVLLEDIVSGKIKRSNENISLFESQGIALEDIAIGFKLLQKANNENIGTELS